MRRRFGGHVKQLQTDGCPEFKAEFKSNTPLFCDRHRVARPYRKNEQSYIESFNRTVRKECLGWTKYRITQLSECQDMAEIFLKRYHYHRPHMGKGMRPPLSSVVSRKQLYNQKSCLKLFGQTYARQKVWGQSWLQSGILQWP